MVIEILIIVMASLLNTLRFESYETLGIVAIIFVFFIIVVTFIRFFYTFSRIYQEYTYTKDDKDIRGVIRKDLGFTKGWKQNYGVNS
jgi:amino acid transporter